VLVLVFSLGQFIGSDLGVLKAGFQKWFSAQNRTVTGEEVWDWMSKNLKPLRLGEITIQEFCDRFNKQFNDDSTAQKMSYVEFIAIFKSMANVSDESQKNITEFVRYLNHHQGKIKCLLVSHTNFCQLDHILSQLQGIQSATIAGELSGLPVENLWLATSMHSKAEQHPDTLAFALKILGFNLDDPKIRYISFLNTIPASEHIDYINPYVENEKKLRIDNLINIIYEEYISTQYTNVDEHEVQSLYYRNDTEADCSAKKWAEKVRQYASRTQDLLDEFSSDTSSDEEGPDVHSECLGLIDIFEQHVMNFYKGNLPPGTDEFCAAARRICRETPPEFALENQEYSQSKYNALVGSRISRLANQTFHHRDYALRLIADIILVPLGYITFGLAFMFKEALTGSSTFLGAKTHRQEKIDELFNDIKPAFN
jgi:hypothetical protein